MERPWVIKTGGELLIASSIRNRILQDLQTIHKRHPAIFVHGGGPQIERELAKNGIPAHFVNGRRVTTPAAMIVVERILSGEINKKLAAQLNTRGTVAAGLSCRDGRLIIGKRLPRLGCAASPHKTHSALLMALLEKRVLPVVSSVASDAWGKAVNINADDAASALAVTLKAKHLFFLTNTDGVLDQNKKRIAVLKKSRIPALIKQGVITKGMIPKVQSAIEALKRGVKEVNIINGRRGIKADYGTRIVQ